MISQSSGTQVHRMWGEMKRRKVTISIFFVIMLLCCVVVNAINMPCLVLE